MVLKFSSIAGSIIVINENKGMQERFLVKIEEF